MIRSSDIGSCARRADFIDGSIEEALAGREPLLFLPCDISDADLWSYGRASYDLRMYGTLANGEKACVRVDDAPVYFDVDASAGCPDWQIENPESATGTAAAVVRRAEIDGIAMMRARFDERHGVVEMRAVWQYPMHGFTLAKHLYIRVIFASLNKRNECLRGMRFIAADLLEKCPNAIAHDDMGSYKSPSYFNALAREYHFATAGWNQLTRWRSHSRVSDGNTSRASAEYCGTYHEFVVSIADIHAAEAPRDAAEESARLHDRTLIESWDIEVENEVDSGDIPEVGGAYTITTISLVYSFAWSETPLVCYVLTLYPSAPARAEDFAMRTHFIACADERDLLITRARVSQRMMPDIRIAFNGACFDWKLFNDKVARYDAQRDVLRCMDLRWCASAMDDARELERARKAYGERAFMDVRVKISADTDRVCDCVAVMAGTLDLDIVPSMMRIYRREEVRFAQSLNKYLEKAHLPPKNDIHFKAMLQMFRRARALGGAGVARECHCGAMDGCAFCASARRVREIDFAVANPSAPMGEWQYRDGHDGGAVVLRDARLEKCCACGARPINEADIARVNTYCAIDSVRPLQLMRKLGVFGDKRELAVATYTSLFDAFYRADGGRVVNFVGSLARKFEIAVTARSPRRPRAHFQGGHVFEPMLGIHDRPVTALDFSSLYPSLILAYNLSPDMIIESEESARILRERGYTLHEIAPFDYEIGDKKGAQDNARMVGRGWSVRHGGIMEPRGTTHTVTYDADDRAIEGRPALPREHLGLFGYALRTLLNSRASVRAGQKVIEEQIRAIIARDIVARAGGDTPRIELDMAGLDDQARGLIARANGGDGARAIDEARAGEIMRAIADLDLRWKCLNSKQLALKVLSNTFYGQMGSVMSPCYTLIGAAGVTAAGRYNIQRVAAFIRELGYTIVYGDTDSVYTRAPERIYESADDAWREAQACAGADANARARALEEYWGAQIIAARADMDALRVRVSAYLRADNGTRFLNMAYEEVSMPTAFFGKKKYVMRPHVKGVTFGARADARGLETVKQGRAGIIRTMGNAIIEDILAIREGKSVTAIVEQRVAEYYDAHGRDMAQYVQYKRYKPAKNNVAVHRFVERMRDRYARLLSCEGGGLAIAASFAPPEPGDKFPFVIVTREVDVSLGGHCVAPSIGDKMEYPHAIEASASADMSDAVRAVLPRLVIDRAYYMEGALMSLFARFVSCDARFAPETDPDAPVFDLASAYDDYDNYRRRRAEGYLREVCARYSGDDGTSGARVRARAAAQRGVVGAFRDVLRSSAREVGVFIDARVARLLVDDRMRAICGGEPGASVSEGAIDELVDVICEIACARSPAERLSESEMFAAHASNLMRVYAPGELAARYERARFDGLMRELDRACAGVRADIKCSFARRVITLFRHNKIDGALSAIASAVGSAGGHGKAQMMPAVSRALAYDEKVFEQLGSLGKKMAEYSVAESNRRRESAMREAFATDGCA